MPTGIELSSGVVVGAPKALDAKYGPYASVALALADLPSAIRYEGLTVGIVNGSTIDEYWFQGGVTNSNFVIKREVLSFPTVLDFPNSGTSGIIYIAQDTGRLYRWANTAYTELSVSTNADWNSTGGVSQILNKPAIPSVPVLASEQTLGDGNPPYENLIRLGQNSIYRFIVPTNLHRGVSFGSAQAGDIAQVVFSGSSHPSSTLTVVRSDGSGGPFALAILRPGTSCSFYNPTGVNTAWIPLRTDVDWNLSSGPNSILNKPAAFPPTVHSHAISDVTGLQTALDNRATLESGKVPSSQLPSYVDDVVEYATLTALQAVSGETSKIYVVLDTNKVYRWSGSAYVEIAPTPVIPAASSSTPTSVGGALASIGTSTAYARADHKHNFAISDINASTLRSHLNVQDGAEVNVNADWNATSGDAQILNKPSIPAAQVNSDWNATSGVAEILNRPDFTLLTNFRTVVRQTRVDTQVYLGSATTVGGSVTVADRIMFLVPFIVPATVALKSYAFRITTAPTTTGNLVFGLYNTGLEGLPDTLVQNSMQTIGITPNTALNTSLTTADISNGTVFLSQGVYWAALLNISGATVTFGGSSPSISWLMNAVLGSNVTITGNTPEALNTFVTIAQGNSTPATLFDRTFQHSVNTASSTTFRFRVSAPAIAVGYYLPYLGSPGGPNFNP